MKRNTKNEKVLRAITIGLATMIAATSAPITVLANDESFGNHDEEQGGQEQSQEQEVVESNIEVCEAAEEIISGDSNDNGDSDNAGYENNNVEEIISGDNDNAEEIISGDNENVENTNNADDNSIYADIEAASSAVEEAPGLAELTVDSSEWTAPVAPENVTPTEIGDVATIAEAFISGEECVRFADQNLDDAAAALMAISTYETDASDTETYIDTAETNLGSFDTYNTTTTANADAAIADATTANTSNSEQEARSAAKNAKEQLEFAQSGLEVAQKAYEKAGQAVDDAEEELEKTRKELAEAQDQLKEANEAMKNAGINATAAKERYDAIEERVKALTEDAEKYESQVDDLRKIEDQSYASLVKYLRSENEQYKKNHDGESYMVFEEGSTRVDIAQTAKNFKDIFGEDKIVAKAKSYGDDNMKLGRNVTRLLVEFMINNDKDVDPATANIQFGVYGEKETIQKNGKDTKINAQSVDIKEGEVYQKSGKWDDTKLVDLKDEDGNTVSKVNWYRTQRGDDGRSNYVVVTYNDKNGVQQTRRFNYVIKNSSYKDENGNPELTDIENGVFYLAEIGTDGSVERIVDDANFDNFSRLVETITAIDNLDKYEEAGRAVEAASQRVTELQNKINELKEVSIDGSRITELEKRLGEAKDELNKASDYKDALESKVQEAQDAVDSIDLSRFDPVDDEEKTQAPAAENATEAEAPAAENATEAEAPVAETATEADTTAPAFTAPSFGTTDDGSSSDDTDYSSVSEAATFTEIPAVTAMASPIVDAALASLDLGGLTTAATGSTTAAFTGTTTGGATGGAAIDATGEAFEETGDGEEVTGEAEENNGVLGQRAQAGTQEQANKKGVRVEDPETPLAQLPNIEDGIEMSWWWLLVIALLGALGKRMYDKHKERVAAREAAKNNIDQ